MTQPSDPDDLDQVRPCGIPREVMLRMMREQRDELTDWELTLGKD